LLSTVAVLAREETEMIIVIEIEAIEAIEVIEAIEAIETEEEDQTEKTTEIDREEVSPLFEHNTELS